MSKQVKLDQYFQQLPNKRDLGSTENCKIRKCDEYLSITLEQFSECTNIKELITADMRDKMPHKFQKKFLLVDKYVKRVYDRYISDSRYRKKPLFKNLEFQPKPWHTKRDRELLKQNGIRKCFVNMYGSNILKDIADSCLQNAIKTHGEEMSDAITKSLPFYVKKILDLYLAKYKTLDGFMRKYRKYSSKIGKAHDKAHNKFSKSTTGVAAGRYWQDVTKNATILTASIPSNCGEESRQCSHLLNISASTQNEDISEPMFLISVDRCSTQKEVDKETPISHTCAHVQEETTPEVDNSEIWNPNRNYKGSNVAVNVRNSFENNAEEYFHVNKLNWLQQEYGLNTSKYIIKPLKKELSEAIELRIKQQYPNVIENIEEVVNKTLICVWDRITSSMEERRDVLGYIGMQSESQGDFALKSEIKSCVGNTEDLAAEAQEIFEELRENKDLPLPKMLTYNEFKEYTNIKEYLYNDIIKKYPYKIEAYMTKIDKYVQKFYKRYILGSDIWPNGIFFKSKDFLKEFHEKHKPQKVKCELDADIHSININESEVTPTSPIICGKSICTKNATTCSNRKRKHDSQTTDVKSDVNIDTYKKQDGSEIIAKEANSPNMHTTQIEINSPLINNGTEMRVDFQSTTKNRLTNQLNAFYGNDIESGLNKPMVFITRHADPQTTNYDNGTAEKRAFENTPRSSPSSLLFVDCNNLQNQFEGPTSESSFNINKEIKKESYIEVSRGNQIRESLYLAEEENDVTFVSCKQPEFIYISDEPLSSSLLLEEMMRSPPKAAIYPYELPAGFSTCCAENTAESIRMEATRNMNCSDNHNYTEQQVAKSLPKNFLESSKNALDLFENSSHELENNDKDKSYKINSNENNRKSCEKKQPKMDLCLESEKGIYDQSSEKNENNTKMSNTNFRPNDEDIAIPDLKITKSKEKGKTTDVMHAKTQQKEKKCKNIQKLKKKDKTLKKIKPNTIKIPATDLTNDLIAQKAHSFRPLLLIKKSKESQQETMQTISVQKERGLTLLDNKYYIEDASLVCSITSEKSDTSCTSTTVDLLSKDNSYFLSSQLSPKLPEPLKNAKSSLGLEHVEKNSKTPAEGAVLTFSGTYWETNFMKNINLHIRSPSNRQFVCITNLFLHQINLKSKINHLNYNSSTPFLQASTWESVEATITVLTSGFNQLSISGPCLNFLFGIKQGEWVSFRQILRYLGVFTYNKKHLESEIEPLPYRVLYNFFKTIPSFSQVIFEYEDANINHVTCLKFNMKIQKPIINLEQAIDSYILKSIENLKNKLIS